jgi:zinc/manganese transport system permease protein
MSDVLLSAFLLSLVLLGIHSYFGLEIIRRGIIFTDLAIGQMAALGAAVSILCWEGRWIYPISLAFALMGGTTIAVVSRKKHHLEAFIGLLYAFGLSAVVIVLSKSYHGMETFQKLMAADILFTPRNEILKTAVIYSFLGLFIMWFQKNTKGAWKDALFFITFSATVTSSVKLAGVLIVFALLVGPAMIALQFRSQKPLFIAWGVGTVINLIAIAVSYTLDLPTGYAIVFFHALIALVASVARTRNAAS